MEIRANIRRVEAVLQSFPAARLMAVTKKRSIAEMELVFESGIHLIGENRVQEMERKMPFLPKTLEKHLIGPLQKNKVHKALELFDVIESVESVQLAAKINALAQELNKKATIYLQINISRETQKHGILAEDLLNMYTLIVQMPNIKIAGLMCIPEFSENLSRLKTIFQEMKILHTKVIQEFKIQERFELSMGMSHDYKIALEEGATLIRIGQGIFEGFEN